MGAPARVAEDKLRRIAGLTDASAELAQAVLRRGASLFAADVASQATQIADRLRGARVLIVGGGGTIGAATTALLVDHKPKAVTVVDLSENYLVELVRTLRGRPSGVSSDLTTQPIDYGSPIMARMLASEPPFDVVLNFAALKHVRSEKDTYSLLQMLSTNVIAHARFKQALRKHGHGATYFAVSTDKAANPTSLMGASKRMAEDVAFEVAAEGGKSTTSVRFANVAFSNGSLLQGFLYRLAKGQPLAVPRDTRRYFVSEREAGELCMLAAFAAPDGHIAFPRLDPSGELQLLQDVATRVLAAAGLQPELYEDEAAARRDVEKLRSAGRWPLLLTPLDTSGEKPFEEFVGAGETQVSFGLEAVSAVKHVSAGAQWTEAFEALSALVSSSEGEVDKRAIVDCIAKAVPTMSHVETGRNLDQRL